MKLINVRKHLRRTRRKIAVVRKYGRNYSAAFHNELRAQLQEKIKEEYELKHKGITPRKIVIPTYPRTTPMDLSDFDRFIMATKQQNEDVLKTFLKHDPDPKLRAQIARITEEPSLLKKALKDKEELVRETARKRIEQLINRRVSLGLRTKGEPFVGLKRTDTGELIKKTPTKGDIVLRRTVIPTHKSEENVEALRAKIEQQKKQYLKILGVK